MGTQQLASLLTVAASKSVISNASISDEHIVQERNKYE